MRPIFRTALVSTLTIAALAAGAVPAMASPTDSVAGDSAAAAPARLSAIQASAAAKTSARIASLNSAIPRVTANRALSDAERSTILGTLNADLAAMKSLAAKIAADTDAATARTDYASIFTGYRVYAVALPQAHFAAAADALTDTVIPRLTAAESKLAAALAGKYASKSTPELQAKLADMTTQIAAATAAADGTAARALAVTPSDYNANHAVMAPIRASIASAHAAAKLARADAKSIMAALK
ncbi:hypothetical protein [Lacisediminihabitans profunda]|uniref:Uncharacterized protein n=1 Tax=Lacisediminihabitans profunda TaxID=2594790 RepID=A0A5C8UQH6_9MICO|nr:hypothetical protein [Lacisediminihabitans profunda]TXN29687.1 hypothetical protein FVP33_11065 [Lacisediminihabitans profunda]